ncbi:peptidoglycan-binding protein [Streptomyces sp. NBC_00377]|uniref:peptidoglycan-binding protein n=1 Tax=unclassified Streptomyces TaxID=2593676 RepID=UPI002E250BF9|nr:MULTISPECIES: peptidoglycan-binding protein [unclassified Streptomyces]
MALRKALPAELDPRARQLLTELRRLKDHGELSMRQLATRTGYSQKSWERYLGGRTLPPREAVEALARISGVDPVRLLAWHEVATDTWKPNVPAGTAAPAGTESPAGTAGPAGTESPAGTAGPAGTRDQAEPESPAGTGSPAQAEVLAGSVTHGAEAGHTRLPGGWLRVALVAGAVALVLAVSSAVLLVVRLDGGHSEPAAALPAPSVAPASSPAPVYTCRNQRTGGLWYAGISRTQDAGLSFGAAGPDVAEAQCLLRRAGISPGGIDGMFGPLTQRAVLALQKRSGLDVDGMIGPHTWKALRG